MPWTLGHTGPEPTCSSVHAAGRRCPRCGSPHGACICHLPLAPNTDACIGITSSEVLARCDAQTRPICLERRRAPQGHSFEAVIRLDSRSSQKEAETKIFETPLFCLDFESSRSWGCVTAHRAPFRYVGKNRIPLVENRIAFDKVPAPDSLAPRPLVSDPSSKKNYSRFDAAP